MATSAKNREKADRLLKRSGEPTINPLNYNETFVRALNWYNTEVENKVKKGWFIAHYKKELKLPFSEIHEREFRQIGTLIRMKDMGNALSEREEQFIQTELERIKALASRIKPVVEVKTESVKKPSIQDRLDEQASDFMAEFDAIIDEFTMDRKQIPDVSRLMKLRPSAPVAKKVAAKLPKMIAELTEVLAGTDKQLVEGYSNFKKPELKKMLAAYEQLASELEQTKKIVVRKPRAKKEVPPAKLVARLKYQKEFPDLGLKSVSPTSIIGCTEIWCYNTKYRRLQKYVALDGMTLTVKGNSIMNFDVEKSTQKGVRKPDQIPALTDKGKRAYGQFLNSLTNKAGPLNGRFSDDTIIMAVFK